MKKEREYFKLHNDYQIPFMALGTWNALNEECYQAVLTALANGYVHIDTASYYNNEVEVGKAIKDSKVNRKDVFITSKLWNDQRGYEQTRKAFFESLEKLKLDYLDLYLLHWPNSIHFRNTWQQSNAESYRALEDLYDEGYIKAIGVSNFQIHHLEELFKTARIKPHVNQIRICPGDTKDDIVKYCQNRNIVIEAYSPLAKGQIYEFEQLEELSLKYNKTIAQIVLRWVYQKGIVSLPKSITRQRIIDNIDIFNFEISMKEMKMIDKLPTAYHWNSNNPDQNDL